MLAILLCIIAFVATYLSARRTLAAGLLAVTAAGYLYGILRANIQSPASHFIFDASLTGLYLAFGARFFDSAGDDKKGALRLWTAILICWPCLLCFLPFQPLMVSLVGLRGNIFFLPILLISGSVRHADWRRFAFGLALLNILALGFGVAEYFRGIEPFFPRSAVTSIIYASGDVAGGNYRIPSLFSSAHAYAGTMVATIPFLFGAWIQPDRKRFQTPLLLAGMVAALCGVLLASTRTYFVIALYFVTIAIFGSALGARKRKLLSVVIVALCALALTNERFQRFKSLSDSDMVVERVAGSVNRSFFEILFEYPMGNGLGGGGTSMPFFLQDRIQRPINIESEYARILAEQGIIGLGLWTGFIVWCVFRRTPFVPHPWRTSRRMIWYWYTLSFVMAAIGIGMLTAIPTTFLFLLAVGWAVVIPGPEPSDLFETSARRVRLIQSAGAAYVR